MRPAALFPQACHLKMLFSKILRSACTAVLAAIFAFHPLKFGKGVKRVPRATARLASPAASLILFRPSNCRRARAIIIYVVIIFHPRSEFFPPSANMEFLYFISHPPTLLAQTAILHSYMGGELEIKFSLVRIKNQVPRGTLILVGDHSSSRDG